MEVPERGVYTYQLELLGIGRLVIAASLLDPFENIRLHIAKEVTARQSHEDPNRYSLRVVGQRLTRHAADHTWLWQLRKFARLVPQALMVHLNLFLV